MHSQRWAWTHKHAVSLFVTSLVAVILAGAGLVGVMVYTGAGSDRAAGGDRAGGDRTAGTGSRSSGGADCLVGSWQVVEQTQGSTLGSALGGATMDLVGDGPRFDFHADGTGGADYGQRTQFETTSLGETVTVNVSGQLTFHYQASEETFQLTEVDSQAQADFPIFGRLPFDLDQEPVSYHCEGDTATFSNPDRDYQARYERRG